MGYFKSAALLTVALLAISSQALAVDYTSMSTEELSKIRGTLYNATDEDRNAFRTEWQSRVSQMSPEDQAKYMGQGKGPGKGMQQGGGNGKGQGQGNGMGGQGSGKK